jgi:hypothetical protein
MLTFTTTLKERAPESKMGYYHRISTEKLRFISVKLYDGEYNCKSVEILLAWGRSHNFGGGTVSPLNGLVMEISATVSWYFRA